MLADAPARRTLDCISTSTARASRLQDGGTYRTYFTDANPACDSPEHPAYERHFKRAPQQRSRVRRTHAYASQPRCADRASAVLASLLRELLLLRHRGGPCLELLPAALHASCARRGSRGEGLERICEIGRVGTVELGWISRGVCLRAMLSGSAGVARGGGGLSGAVAGFPNSRVSSPRRPLPWAG